MRAAALTARRKPKRRKIRMGRGDNGMFKNNVFQASIDTKQWFKVAGISGKRMDWRMVQ